MFNEDKGTQNQSQRFQTHVLQVLLLAQLKFECYNFRGALTFHFECSYKPLYIKGDNVIGFGSFLPLPLM